MCSHGSSCSWWAAGARVLRVFLYLPLPSGGHCCSSPPWLLLSLRSICCDRDKDIHTLSHANKHNKTKLLVCVAMLCFLFSSFLLLFTDAAVYEPFWFSACGLVLSVCFFYFLRLSFFSLLFFFPACQFQHFYNTYMSFWMTTSVYVSISMKATYILLTHCKMSGYLSILRKDMTHPWDDSSLDLDFFSFLG